MIHAFAVEPKLAATWGRLEEFRFIHDKFGLGTPRILLELPAFNNWKRKVYETATELRLSDTELKRVEELFKILGEHRCRPDALYDGVLSWLENAECEHARRPFAAILATDNPRRHASVLVGDQVGAARHPWACPFGASPARTPEALALALSPMLKNCREVHFVDPNFGPENSRHTRVLSAFLKVVAANGLNSHVVRVHCGDKSKLAFFEQKAAEMASRFPHRIPVEFVRWREKAQRFHNRYVLTDVGGVMLGDGLDDANGNGANQTDDVHLLDRAQYTLRWSQYADENGDIELVDKPKTVQCGGVSGRRR